MRCSACLPLSPTPVPCHGWITGWCLTVTISLGYISVPCAPAAPAVEATGSAAHHASPLLNRRLMCPAQATRAVITVPPTARTAAFTVPTYPRSAPRKAGYPPNTEIGGLLPMTSACPLPRMCPLRGTRARLCWICYISCAGGHSSTALCSPTAPPACVTTVACAVYYCQACCCRLSRRFASVSSFFLFSSPSPLLTSTCAYSTHTNTYTHLRTY